LSIGLNGLCGLMGECCGRAFLRLLAIASFTSIFLGYSGYSMM
jgi:hypothetical protein